MCANGTYCPISPTEPHDRLLGFHEQVRGKYALVHARTSHQFPLKAIRNVVSLDVILHPSSFDDNMQDMPICSGHGAAYIICTSGTVGEQKLVVHTHKSFSACDYTCAQYDLWMHTVDDHVLQVASCSWILHLTEISMTLTMGGTLVLLRPGGQLDMPYFTHTISRQEVTALLIGPSLIRALTSYLEMTEQHQVFKQVRRLSTTGNRGAVVNSEFFINCLYII